MPAINDDPYYLTPAQEKAKDFIESRRDKDLDIIDAAQLSINLLIKDFIDLRENTELSSTYGAFEDCLSYLQDIKDMLLEDSKALQQPISVNDIDEELENTQAKIADFKSKE